MIFSTIDIGTNTILMVTVEAEQDGTIRVIGDEHEVARLGRGVDESRMIRSDAFDRVERYLNGYLQIARSLGSERIVAFGTSALRDARNRDEFITAMRERTGIGIKILSGEQEAELTYQGALFGLDLPAHAASAVLDIGGGSTEIALGSGDKLLRSTSLDVGAVRVTERFIPTLPPSPEDLEQARRFVREQLASAFDLPPDTLAVGVAGTVTTLGAITANLPRFDADELNGWRLDAETISEICNRLSTLTLDETRAIPQISEGRADIILAGTLILEEFMIRYRLPEIVVSTRGVRYGMMLREAEQLLH